MELQARAPEVWTVDVPLTIAGAELGTRMTVVRLGDGGLVLIAPCPIDEALAGELAGLGPVRALIAPNAFHHFYFVAAAKRYPEAACFVAEGVKEKLSEAPGRLQILSHEPEPLWKADLEQCRIEGAPLSNEVVFFHPTSKTLVLTDLCFNFDPAPSGWTGLFLRLAGAHGRLAVSRLMRFVLKDRSKVRASIARIQSWDFERIIVSHGALVTRDAKRRFARATVDV
jgi:hypothetical protein